jgi:hypothetical protein
VTGHPTTSRTAVRRARLLRYCLVPRLAAVLLCAAGCRSDRAPRERTPEAATDSSPTARAGDTADAAAAAAVIRRYYEAIDARDYHTAYREWEQSGAASGQSFSAFRGGFAETADVTVQIGEPGRVEGAAGSRYVDVPVTITAHTTGGVVQHFAGTYVLRRVVVPGASPEQRTWHIYSAKIAAVDE